MSAGAGEPEETVWEGRFIAAKRRGKWEYVSRTRGVSAAVIIAIDDGHVILVEQFRAPLQKMCVELPAGLVGDETAGEAVAAAAIRELEEETGYRAERMVELGRFFASPGMSAEGFTLLRAEGLTRTGEGGGVGGEDIQVHRVPLGDVADFVAGKRAEGAAVDGKMLLLLAPDFIGSGRATP
ncbi:MAG: ADP-ribose pyrophosphatase [Sphingomonadales bacterium]|nr:ADP-ribose pyrophosphatase [Sphingomonadales bacterium]